MRIATRLRSWWLALVASLTPRHVVQARRLQQSMRRDAVRLNAKERL
jgi:hypothetical protein